MKMVDSIVMCKCLIFLVIQLQMCHLAGKKRNKMLLVLLCVEKETF